MAQILHMKCRRCGEKLKNSQESYCPPCNIYLCYRAMPILFGMIFTGHLAPDLSSFPMSAEPPEDALPSGYEDENMLILE